MFDVTYAQLVAGLLNGEILEAQMNDSWYMFCAQPDGVISTEPVIVRVERESGKRVPWAPNTVDILEGKYKVLKATVSSADEITLDEGSLGWAVNELVNGNYVRRVDWKNKGMHACIADVNVDGETQAHIRLRFPNGNTVPREYHPDFLDVPGQYAVYVEAN